MKFATLIHDGQQIAVVDSLDGGWLPLSTVDPELTSLRRLIAAEAAVLEAVRAHRARTGLPTLDPAAASFAPPVGDPSKMLFMALNNTAIDQHLRYRPDFPAYFPKLPSSLLGHAGSLQLQPHHGLTHPEPELGVVIGRTARNVPLARAMDHVFGYTVINDITSVGMRKEDVLTGYYPMPRGDGTFRLVEESFLYPGRYKNVDGFCPMGPWLVHKDDIDDPMRLKVQAWVDDELVIADNTRNLHFSVEEVIHWVSHHQTLLPGDIISMGTAVHPDETNKPLSYADLNRSGRIVRVEIEGIGTLSTQIARVTDSPDPREYFAANKRFTPADPQAA